MSPEGSFLFRWTAVVVALFIAAMAIGVLAYARYNSAVRFSRYATAYVACENTNAKHARLIAYIDRVPSADRRLFEGVADIQDPLRDGRDGRPSCRQYALREVAQDLAQ